MSDNKIQLKNLEKTNQTAEHKQKIFERSGVGVEKKEQEKTDYIQKTQEKINEQEIITEEVTSEPGGIVAAGNAQRQKQHRKEEIEKILEQDLEEIYLNMSTEKQEEFKKVGEATAQKINDLLDKTKIKIKTIINLIKKWLSIIPKINKFFLEQEAKIKADAIVKKVKSS
ncbi:MAG: hypothetical protein V1768_03785 [Patescibacteria group bacterium]|nr:hypothetical protein [Patescibacteria group bacterium]MBU1160650.1 hypothetical protein [Patescibacteria group bacterium]MBU1684543.1 hypothetical protein [Patescibacteria group bacterium]MBU1778621.1 hypothetical protein [Patescibacteria group bacterium]MBU1987436.1 hypothetical protein [Patescibacteria group bacterium]